MKVLALGDEHAMHKALLEQAGSRAEPFDVQAFHWQSFNSEQLILLKPDVIVVLALLPYEASKELMFAYHQQLQSLLDYAEQESLPILFLSSAAVFDGARIAYHEQDKTCPNSEYGYFYDGLEKLFTSYQHSIVIRTAWLYSTCQHSFLAQVIRFAEQGKCIRINSAAKANPTSTEDLARVFLAVLLQLEQGADNWGVFHYVAAEPALGFQFVEAVLQQANKYNQSINPKQVCFEHHQQADVEFYFPAVALKCKRLQGNFGIHQRAWRSLMPAVVRQYYGVE